MPEEGLTFFWTLGERKVYFKMLELPCNPWLLTMKVNTGFFARKELFALRNSFLFITEFDQGIQVEAGTG